jgi:hypothetical protein
MMLRITGKVWAGRLLIGLVLASNLLCAILFIWKPASYAGGFELEGAIGAAMIRGFGVLFLMWNVPYLLAAIDPVKRRLSLHEAIAMQAIGVVGETFILASLPIAHAVARQSLMRFVVFDVLGLILLLLAGWATRRSKIAGLNQG